MGHLFPINFHFILDFMVIYQLINFNKTFILCIPV